MRSITTIDLQYAHRFYGFKGEAQYLHGHTGVLTIEVEDSINEGTLCSPQFLMSMKNRALKMAPHKIK